jgi:hypothetical protein
MFAAPNPSEIRDVEAQRQAAAQQNAAMYPPQQNMYGQQQTDPSMMSKGNGQQPGTTADTVPKSTVARVAATMHWGTFMLLISFFSMMVMIASAQVCDVTVGDCEATRGYQVAVGVVSMVLAFVVGILDYAGKLSEPKQQVPVSVFFFLWWTAAVIVLTFFGDFQTTNRAAGYFSSWGAFILTIISLAAVSSGFEQGMDKTLQSVRKPLFFLAIASLVTMGAAIGPCSPRSQCKGYPAYAIVVSVLSLFIAIILFFLPARVERKSMRFIAYFLVLWWIFGVAVMTLGGPFQVAGNGFFGSYCALLASAWFAAILTRNT